jgi:hypothetical protein
MTIISWFAIGGVFLMVVGFLLLVWSNSDYFTRQYGILGWIIAMLGSGFLTLGILMDRGKEKERV